MIKGAHNAEQFDEYLKFIKEIRKRIYIKIESLMEEEKEILTKEEYKNAVDKEAEIFFKEVDKNTIVFDDYKNCISVDSNNFDLFYPYIDVDDKIAIEIECIYNKNIIDFINFIEPKIYEFSNYLKINYLGLDFEMFADVMGGCSSPFEPVKYKIKLMELRG